MTTGKQPIEVVTVFTARFDDLCDACDVRIRADDQMARTRDHTYICWRCTP